MMSEFVGNSATNEQEEQKLDTRAEVKRLTGLTIFVIVVTVLAVLVAVAVYAQDKEAPNAQDKYSSEVAERNRVLRLQGL